jgi:hypothetical protein
LVNNEKIDGRPMGFVGTNGKQCEKYGFEWGIHCSYPCLHPANQNFIKYIDNGKIVPK